MKSERSIESVYVESTGKVFLKREEIISQSIGNRDECMVNDCCNETSRRGIT